MLVPDFMHEFELGIWKALFIHLIHVLYAAAQDGSLVRELDHRLVTTQIQVQHLTHQSFRYRQISTFGTSTIRNFATNASEMKKLAARD